MRALLLFSKLSSNFFHAFAAVGSPSINFTYASSVWISISPLAWLDTFLPSTDSGSSNAHSHPLYARSPRNLAFHVDQFSPQSCGIDTLSPAITTTLSLQHKEAKFSAPFPHRLISAHVQLSPSRRPKIESLRPLHKEAWWAHNLLKFMVGSRGVVEVLVIGSYHVARHLCSSLFYGRLAS